MKIALVLPLFLFTAYEGFCCTTCNRQVQDKIYDDSFLPNLFIMLSAFFVLGILVAALAYLSGKKHQALTISNPEVVIPDPVPLTTAAMVLGIGLGGFLDGIVLHQILQWHEMISNRLPPVTLVNKSVNMFWDGIFHLFTLTVTFIGILLLWKLSGKPDANYSGKVLAGGLLVGWGLFNIIEGVIDHQILKLHNVREITGNVEAWNLGFLGISVLLVILGYWLIRTGAMVKRP